jgi:hypothetical protein
LAADVDAVGCRKVTMTGGRTDFYTVKYTSFGSDVATELRRQPTSPFV